VTADKPRLAFFERYLSLWVALCMVGGTLLVLFVPIVRLLVAGDSSLAVPYGVLLWSVVVFIAIPFTAGAMLRWRLARARGLASFEGVLLPRFAPLTIASLLATLVFLFAFQADKCS